MSIRGDLELDRLNDEELFAAGTAFFAAENYEQAARHFDRLSDHFPGSPHRGAATFNAGLSHQRLKQWDEARFRFESLADAEHGTGDALDAAFRLAETMYHQEDHRAAALLLSVIAQRTDLDVGKRIEAQVQQGVCELESGQLDSAESTFRKVMSTWQSLQNPDVVDDYYPAQAQFFLGETFRLHYEAVQLVPDKGSDQLARDLELKAELLLSAQGHYLRAIRIGNGHWATAAGARIGGLYENLYDHMMAAPAPSELNPEEAAMYQEELHKKIRVLLTKAITIYERTLETAERVGAKSVFVEGTRESLAKMKQRLLNEGDTDAVPRSSLVPLRTPIHPVRLVQVPPAFHFATVGSRFVVR